MERYSNDAKGLFDCFSARCGRNTGLSSTDDAEDQDSVLDSSFIETRVLLIMSALDEWDDFVDAFSLVNITRLRVSFLCFSTLRRLVLSFLSLLTLCHLVLRFRNHTYPDKQYR